MPYYKDTAGALHFIDDAAHAAILPEGCTAISDADAAALLAAQSAALPARPDPNGFANDLKTAMGGIVGSNLLARAYPLFYSALEQGTFSDVQALVIDAHATGVLSDAVYAQFKALAAKYNIPMVLP